MKMKKRLATSRRVFQPILMESELAKVEKLVTEYSTDLSKNWPTNHRTRPKICLKNSPTALINSGTQFQKVQMPHFPAAAAKAVCLFLSCALPPNLISCCLLASCASSSCLLSGVKLGSCSCLLR